MLKNPGDSYIKASLFHFLFYKATLVSKKGIGKGTHLTETPTLLEEKMHIKSQLNCQSPVAYVVNKGPLKVP